MKEQTKSRNSLSFYILLMLVAATVISAAAAVAVAMFAPHKLLMYESAALLLEVIIFSVLGWIILNRRLTRPLQKVITVANNVEKGALGPQNTELMHSIKSRDELGLLAASMDRAEYAIGKVTIDVRALRAAISNKDLTGDISSLRAAVSEKKLTGNENFEHQGRYKEVIMAIQDLLSELREMIKNTGLAAQQVSSRSEQLAQCAQSLAQGSSEQAAAIEEIAAIVGEVVSRTRKSSEDALRSKETVELIHRQAEDGDEKMKRLLVALEEINEASLNISKIIKTIEDIAFQTNILALNASVEAARAGVHGKGFAVVAEEVKNLAVKSAAAANETKVLINTNVTKAKDGAAIGKDMRKSLDSMVAGIDEALKAIQGIAAESRRQVDIIDQLNAGLEQISQVVQNNTATAEESASSSEELLSQARLMSEMVSKFKVE